MALSLSPSVNGSRRIGELLLTERELLQVNEFIASHEFRFIQAQTLLEDPSTDVKLSDGPPNTAPTSSTHASPATGRAHRLTRAQAAGSQTLKDSKPATTVDTKSATRKSAANKRQTPVSRKKNATTSSASHVKEQIEQSQTAAKSQVNSKRRKISSGGVGKESSDNNPSPKPSPKSQHIVAPSHPQKPATVVAAAIPPPSPTLAVQQPHVIVTDLAIYRTTTACLTVPAPRKSPVVRDPNSSWTTSCRLVLDALEKNPQAKWFLNPVDTQVEGTGDYFDKIKTPMDFQTVRQKLENGMYGHPFRWQHDIRTIFFNAFSYYPHGSPIWRSAAELAVVFENICKETIEVNPYTIFKKTVPKPVPPPTTVQEQQNQFNESAPKTAPVTSEAALLTPTYSDFPPPITSSDGTITLDHAQLKALLAQAANTGVAALNPNPKTTTSGGSPDKALSPEGSRAVSVVSGAIGSAKNIPTRNKKKSGPTAPEHTLPPGVVVSETGGVTYTTECAGTPLALEYGRIASSSAVPAPQAIPSVQILDSKFASFRPSQAQKKNALARFKELDVTYRKALLDSVKDELGIHPPLCAQDIRYLPNLDLLPPIKARQFFLYMKVLTTQQKAAQDAYHRPITLARTLNLRAPTKINAAVSRAADGGGSTPSPTPAIVLSLPKIPSEAGMPAGSSWSVSANYPGDSREDQHPERSDSSESESQDSDSSAQDTQSISSSSSFEEAEPQLERFGQAAAQRPGFSIAQTQPGSNHQPFMHARSAMDPFMRSAQPPNLRHSLSSSTSDVSGSETGRAKGGFSRQPFGSNLPQLGASPKFQFPKFNQTVPGFGGLGKQRPPGLPGMQMPGSSLGIGALPHGLGLWGGGNKLLQSQQQMNVWLTPSTESAVNNRSSCWGEWKSKVMQEAFISKERNVGVASERETRAERADAEI